MEISSLLYKYEHNILDLVFWSTKPKIFTIYPFKFADSRDII